MLPLTVLCILPIERFSMCTEDGKGMFKLKLCVCIIWLVRVPCFISKACTYFPLLFEGRKQNREQNIKDPWLPAKFINLEFDEK